MSSYSPPSSAVSLDHLLALNDELAALVRCGVPLERGLLALGRDMPGRMGDLAVGLAERLARGESLPDILRAEPNRFPRLYAAVVAAGWKSGRPAQVLEAMADTGRRLAELRRVVGVAAIYPTVVLLMAYCLFVAVLLKSLLVIQDAQQRWGASAAANWTEYLTAPGAVLARYWPVLPLVVLTGLLAWWLRSGRSLLVEPARARRWFGWIPGIRGLLDRSQMAMFADSLALLIDHDVPLGEALVLASEASGGVRLRQAAADLAAAIGRGESLSSAQAESVGLPPMVGWLLASNRPAAALATGLRHAAQSYRRRAIRRSQILRAVVPMLLTVGVGGMITLAYTLSVFLPWLALLRGMAEQQ